MTVSELVKEPETAADFANNLAVVSARIAAACAAAGRNPEEVRLLPVSKTIPEERLRHAIAAGATLLGENKVQEAKRKWENLRDTPVKWAVIGHLQRNKAKDVAEFASEFQALDSDRLAAALDTRLRALGRSLDVFIQVNTSGEDSKFGFAPEAVPEFLATVANYTALRVRGFMTLAVNSPDTEKVRACFRQLREIRDRAQAEHGTELIGDELSMGMSGDFELAIAEGSNCVRVGQAIFGARNYAGN